MTVCILLDKKIYILSIDKYYMVKWIVVNMRTGKKPPVKPKSMFMVIGKVIVDYYLKYKKPVPSNVISRYFDSTGSAMKYFNSVGILNIKKIDRHYYLTPTQRMIDKFKNLTYKEIVMKVLKKKKELMKPENFQKYISSRPIPIHVIM